jgi:hypothetical protein
VWEHLHVRHVKVDMLKAVVVLLLATATTTTTTINVFLPVIRWQSSVKFRSQQEIKAIYPTLYE